MSKHSRSGYYTVARLAQHGAHVYLCARSIEKGNSAIVQIKSLHPQAQITLLRMDHLDLSSVVSAAKEFLSKEPVLHGLVNNAGIMATPYEITKDGYESQWQTNYLAHWVFTSHLIPCMRRTSQSLPPGSGSVRIVNVSSSGHWFRPKNGINFADTSLREANAMTRYGQSKLANVLHIKTLHKLYGPGSSPAATAAAAAMLSGQGEIWCSIVHPGLVESNLGQHADFPSWVKYTADLYAKLGGRMHPDKGSWTSVFCVASPQMRSEQCGGYFQRIAEVGWQSKQAKDAVLAAKLEDWTKREMEKWLK